MRFIIILGGWFLAAQSALCEPTGDVDKGRKLARQCQTCHGIDGFAKIPIAPHIGGESVAYLARQLTSFRDGTRRHEMMTVAAKGLTNTAIADLAAWYAFQTIETALPDGVSGLDAPAQCVDCHGATGLAIIEDAPNLAGETTIYIDTQLRAFRTGKRQHDLMTPIARNLSDGEIRQAAEWYAATIFTVLP